MLFDLLYELTDLHIFQSRYFAASAAVILSFLSGLFFFPMYIRKLQSLSFSSELETSKHQPVMPAGILFMSVIIPVVLITSRFSSPFVLSALLVYVFYALIGSADDIAKIVNKRKLLRNEISKKEYQYKTDGISAPLRLGLYLIIAAITATICYFSIPGISNEVTIPFLGGDGVTISAWFFIPLMTVVIATMANGVNFTDGMDTLSTVPLLTNFAFIAIIAYISSRPDWSQYFLVPQVQGINELIPMVGAVVGILLAFLWFNSPPSDIIMGDSGSIGLGGLLGIMIVFVKAEFYLPVIGFIFLVEFASSFIQIFWYKLTKTRIFRMAPIHHHYQMIMRDSKRYSESEIRSKITWRFHIISVLLFVVGLVLFLKVR